MPHLVPHFWFRFGAALGAAHAATLRIKAGTILLGATLGATLCHTLGATLGIPHLLPRNW